MNEHHQSWTRPETTESERAETAARLPSINNNYVDGHQQRPMKQQQPGSKGMNNVTIELADQAQPACSANSELMRILRESYEVSKSRMSDISKTPAGLLHLQIHGAHANRVYDALSTLIYGSISAFKAEELERYIRKKSKTLPPSIFDIDEWEQILDIARDARMGDLVNTKQELEAQKQDILVRSWMTTSAAIAARAQVLSLRDGVEKDFTELQTWMTGLGVEIQKKVEQFMNDETMRSNETEMRLTSALITAEEIRQQLVECQLSEAKLQAHISYINTEHESAIKNLSIAHAKDLANELARRDEAASEAARSREEELSSRHETAEAKVSQLREEHDLAVNKLKETNASEVGKLLQEINELKQARSEAVDSINTLLERESHRSDLRIADLQTAHAAKLAEEHDKAESEKATLRLQITSLEASNQELSASIAAMVTTQGTLIASESQKSRLVASLTEEVMQLKLEVQEATTHSTHTGTLLAHEMDVLRERLIRETADLDATKDKLKDAELAVSTLSAHRSELESQLSAEKDSVSALKASLQQSELALATIQQKHSEEVARSVQLEAELHALTESVTAPPADDYNHELTQAHAAQIESAAAAVLHAQEKSAELEQRCEHLDAEVLLLKTELASAKSQAEALQQQLDNIATAAAAAEHKEREEKEHTTFTAAVAAAAPNTAAVTATTVELQVAELKSQIQLLEIQIADFKAIQKRLITERGPLSSRSLNSSTLGMNIPIKTTVHQATPPSAASNDPPTDITADTLKEEENEDTSHPDKQDSSHPSASGDISSPRLDEDGAPGALLHQSVSAESALSATSIETSGSTSSGVRWAITAAILDPSDEVKVVLLADHYRVLEEVQAEHQKEIEEILASHGDELSSIISDRIPVEDHTRLIQELQLQHVNDLANFAEISKEKVDEIEAEATRASEKFLRDSDELRNKCAQLEKQLQEARLHLFDAVAFSGSQMTMSASRQSSMQNINAATIEIAGDGREGGGGEHSSPVTSSGSAHNHDGHHGTNKLGNASATAATTATTAGTATAVVEEKEDDEHGRHANESALREEIEQLTKQLKEVQDLYAAKDAELQALQGDMLLLRKEVKDSSASTDSNEAALTGKVRLLETQIKEASDARAHTEAHLKSEIHELEGKLVAAASEAQKGHHPSPRRRGSGSESEISKSVNILREELIEKDRLLVVTTDELTKMKEAFENLSTRAALDISGLNSQVASLQDDLKSFEKKLRENDSENFIEEVKRILTLRQILMVQSVIRGFLNRVKVKRTKLFHSARLSGVLVALKTNKQGQTGWYISPNGLLYYFLLDNEDWVLTAGPITRDQYESAINNCRRAGLKGEPILVKCGFSLAIDHSDTSPGEVYIQRSTEKLFIAVDVDGFMMRHHSTVSYLSSSQSLVEGASLAIELPSSPVQTSRTSAGTSTFFSPNGDDDEKRGTQVDESFHDNNLKAE